MSRRRQGGPPKSKRNNPTWLNVVALAMVAGTVWLLYTHPPGRMAGPSRLGPGQLPATPTNTPTVPQSQLPATSPDLPLNAFDDFSRAIGLISPPPRDAEFTELLSGVSTGAWRSDERLDSYLTRNEAALAELDRGFAKTNCVLPRYENPESSLGYLDSLHTLARLQSLRVKKWIADGRIADAAGEAARIVKFGDMILRGDGPLVAYRMGIAIKHIGYDTVEQLLAQAEIPEATLRNLAGQLGAYQLDGNALAHSLEVEHRAVGLWLLEAAKQPDFAATATAVAGGQPSAAVQTLLQGPPMYSLEHTSNLMEQLFTMADFNATHPWSARKDMEGVLDAVLATPFDLRKEDNTFGLVVLHLVFDQVPPTLMHRRRMEAEAISVRALCELAIYYRQHGNLPDALGDAVIDLPADPFSGQPLHYSKERGLLWSVGPDGVDDHAELAFTNGSTRGDLIVPIRFATAKPAN